MTAVQWCPSSRDDRLSPDSTLPVMKNTECCVVANHPEHDESFYVELQAISPDEAKRAARAVLAKTKRDHFSIVAVLEVA